MRSSNCSSVMHDLSFLLALSPCLINLQFAGCATIFGSTLFRKPSLTEYIWSRLTPPRLFPLFLALYQPYVSINEKSNSSGKSLREKVNAACNRYFRNSSLIRSASVVAAFNFFSKSLNSRYFDEQLGEQH